MDGPRRPSGRRLTRNVDDPALGELVERCRFPDGGSIDLAVSGGADSLALLALSLAAGCEPTIHHGHHGLRSGADDDAELVTAIGRDCGVDVRIHRLEVVDGANLEERARLARRRAFPEGTATGHTLDDQAETLLLNLLRGAGPRGLGAMRPGPTHPILALRRSETSDVCRRLAWTPADDPTNSDPRFTRNRIRHEVVPLLDAISGRDVVRLLGRAADSSRATADFVDRVADDVDPSDARRLAGVADVVAHAAIQRWWRRTTGCPPLGAAAVGRVLDVARGDATRHDLAAGWRVQRRHGRLSIVEVPHTAHSRHDELR